ncbi:MAG: SHOCT domain-containing protein [Ruaniaceae bacterium]|nr:SHOCT domain-containing protein [Ruaniaceae bacterium]
MPDFLSSLWNTFLWFFMIFVFVAYLMALFSIIQDLIRDKSLGGWAKAIWLLFLIWLPFLTALVYLIARGKGMNVRASERVAASRNATDDYIRSVAATAPATEVAKAHDLLDAGFISEAEYAQMKAKILAAS